MTPPAGGDTLFASMYDALSPAMRSMLDPLWAVSSSALADVSRTREDRICDADGSGDVPCTRRCIRSSGPTPETGRRAL